MSVSIYANTIIGLPIDSDKLFEYRTVKAFDHDYTDPEMKFCPKTGKELWEGCCYLRDIIDDYEDLKDDEDISGLMYDECIFIGGYQVVSADDNYYVCLKHMAVDRDGGWGQGDAFCKLPTDNQVNNFKRVMKEKELWNDDDSFGVHSIMYCGG